MPKVNSNAGDQARSPLVDAVEARVAQLSITTDPILIVGVNRKLGTGNFENVDLYAGLSLPLPGASLDDKEELQRLVELAAELGFSIVSQETGQRYSMLKEMQRSGRK